MAVEYIHAIGRRKSAVARVYLTQGTGKITINKRELADYFPSELIQFVVKQPLNLLGVVEQYDIKAPTLYGRIMAVLDYISGMTDSFAYDQFDLLYGTRR